MSAPRADPHGWRARIAPWARDFAPDPHTLLALTEHPSRVLRDDARSRVLLLDSLPGAPAGPWVAKRPLWRDGRAWNRLVSLVARGEMARAFAGGLRLLELGLATPRPVLVLERRRRGLLVESWLLYQFAAGQPVAETHWPLVVRALERLHAAGLRHGDPHLANWLAAPEGGVIALDPNPRRLRRWLADDAYDFLQLRNCRPEILPLLPLRGTWQWRLAEGRFAVLLGWRRLKRLLRGA
jgi:hypothetical protein